jgi:hypothetical protein
VRQHHDFFKKYAGTDGRVYGQDADAVRLARNGKNEFFELFLTDGGPLGYPTIFRDVCPYPGDSMDVEYDWLVWHDGLVQRTAEAAVEEEKYDELYVLADMLQEAGCNHTRLISHLREPKGHMVGCWALDLLLGRL